MFALAIGAHAADPAPSTVPSAQPSLGLTNSVTMPQPLPDPIEPVNRLIWGFNKWLLADLIKPTAKVYRTIVHPPVRKGVANFGRNLVYPGRLINHLLQARWRGAREETYRFGCNTVLGIGGVFDVATHFHIPKSDADFGQTLGKWGWNPQAFVMLPLYGPSSDRDTFGLAGDIAANPLNYWSPYRINTQNPVTYLGPSSYANYVVMYNNLAESVDKNVRAIKAGSDAYADLKFAWGYLRDTHKPDPQLTDPPDRASLETLGAALFGPTDPEFPGHGKTRSVWLYTTGREFTFTYWLQKTPAPIVYIVPGLGSHRLSDGALGLAELIYQQGYSAVTVSSPFNYEFMDSASTAQLPAYTPQDAADLHFALTQIDGWLAGAYPDHLASRALLGYSMGAFESLFIVAQQDPGAHLLAFDRVVAIDTPVRLLHGMTVLDDMFNSPLAWPAAQRESRMEDALVKAAALLNAPDPSKPPYAFSGTESRFLVGVAFRMILRDTIYTSQSNYNEGVLQRSFDPLRRSPLYREILQYSFEEYLQDFVGPYYRTRGVDLNAADAFALAGDLRRYQQRLQPLPTLRLIVNANDPLLSPEDLDWLKTTFDPNRLTVFPNGGHLGNLSQPEVQGAILQSLNGLVHDR